MNTRVVVCTALLLAFAVDANPQPAHAQPPTSGHARSAKSSATPNAKAKRAGRKAKPAAAPADAGGDFDLDALTATTSAKTDASLTPDALVALVKPRERTIAVASFEGTGGEHLRKVVLEVLSEHTDLALLGFRDIEVVAHRLGIGMTESEERKRLGSELKVYAWVDGNAESANVRLTDAHGQTLAELKLDAEHAAAQARKRLWGEFGRFISDEGLRQYLVGSAREAAMRMLAAQGAELEHQQQIALQREQERAQRLAAAKVHARTCLDAQSVELQRQVTVAANNRRKGEELIRQAALAQQAEAARLAQLAQQAQMAQQAEAARQAQLAQQAQMAQQAQYANQPPAVYPQPQAYPAPQPAYGAYAVPPPAAYGPPQPSGRFGGSPSPAPPSAAPVAPAPGEVDGISPETRKWLQEHRSRTQGGSAP